MNSIEKQHDWARTQDFFNLELPNNKACIEYVWIGGKNCIRSKAKTVNFVPKSASELPAWNYDGSSTFQASGKDSEVIMVPRSLYKDPFRKGNNFLVMCDTYDGNGNALASNTRLPASKIFDQALDEEPWYGLEQEYTMFTVDGHPFGWPKGGFPGPQGPYYCSAGANVAHGRHLVEAHYRACLYAGISVSGVNAEVMPGQWEYQIGPVQGIEAADQLWISRYILHRMGEIFNIVISFDPKPVLGDWNGAGLHTNFSTKKMREAGGIKHIFEAVDKLKDKHHEHIAIYGEGNERRLTGKHETAPIHEFSCGIAHRGASIRIVREAINNGCGYFEDRRPASNADPYLVTSKIFETCVLYKKDAAPAAAPESK